MINPKLALRIPYSPSNEDRSIAFSSTQGTSGKHGVPKLEQMCVRIVFHSYIQVHVIVLRRL
jgi:hypothetical protein